LPSGRGCEGVQADMMPSP